MKFIIALIIAVTEKFQQSHDSDCAQFICVPSYRIYILFNLFLISYNFSRTISEDTTD